MVDHLPALVKATKPIEYLDIEATGFEAATIEGSETLKARARRYVTNSRKS